MQPVCSQGQAPVLASKARIQSWSSKADLRKTAVGKRASLRCHFPRARLIRAYFPPPHSVPKLTRVLDPQGCFHDVDPTGSPASNFAWIRHLRVGRSRAMHFPMVVDKRTPPRVGRCTVGGDFRPSGMCSRLLSLSLSCVLSLSLGLPKPRVLSISLPPPSPSYPLSFPPVPLLPLFPLLLPRRQRRARTASPRAGPAHPSSARP